MKYSRGFDAWNQVIVMLRRDTAGKLLFNFTSERSLRLKISTRNPRCSEILLQIQIHLHTSNCVQYKQGLEEKGL